jgi:hypothetical protein
MLIRKKLRPKELNEFNRYFGDLKHASKLPNSGTTKEIIEDGKISSRVILSSEKMFTQELPKGVEKIHSNILSTFEQDMNRVQKQILAIFCEMQRNEYLVLMGEKIKTAEMEDVAKIRQIIYAELLSEEFIKAMRNTSALYEIELEVADNGYPTVAGYITEENDFGKMEFPKYMKEKVESYSLTRIEENRLKFYYLLLLDILAHPFLQSSLLVIKLNRPIYWCLVRVLRNMDGDFRAFWQSAGRFVEGKLYPKDENILYKELLEGADERRGEELLKENFYYNIATGLILSNELQIQNFLNLTSKDEKNIVINEAVKLVRCIIKNIEKDFGNFTPQMLFSPSDNELKIREIVFIMSTFRFSHIKFEELLLSKGLQKPEWYFFKSLVRTYSEEYMEKAYEEYNNANIDTILELNSLAINYSLNSIATANPNLTQLGKYVIVFELALMDLSKEEKALEQICQELIALTGSKRKMNINKEVVLEAQKRKGVEEKRLRLFTFFVEEILYL